MESNLEEPKKKIKKWLCKQCKKEYCFMKSAIKHSKKLGHTKFTEINKQEFKL